MSRLGILGIDIDNSVLDLIGELRKPAGVLVAASVAGEPGAEDGLRPGDLIVSLNGDSVFNLASLREILGKLEGARVLKNEREDRLRFAVLEIPLTQNNRGIFSPGVSFYWAAPGSVRRAHPYQAIR